MFGKDGSVVGNTGAETVRMFDLGLKILTTIEVSGGQMKMPWFRLCLTMQFLAGRCIVILNSVVIKLVWFCLEEQVDARLLMTSMHGN